MVTIDEFIEELKQEAQATERLLMRIPEKDFGWRPHEKSMTLGQLAQHIASLPAAIAEIATRPSFDVKTRIPRPEATSIAGLLATLEKNIAKASELLAGMDEAMLSSTWRMMDGDREIFAIPRKGLLRSVMLNHWYHHRGQLTVYLRELGVPLPATYGSSADESPF